MMGSSLPNKGDSLRHTGRGNDDKGASLRHTGGGRYPGGPGMGSRLRGNDGVGRGNDGISDTMGRPFRDIRISVTDRCNFRCPYCMPAEIFGERYEFLPKAELLTFEEIERVARVFVGLGARKVRITGGEPLVRNDVEGLVARLAAIPGLDDLTMTTNGYLLPRKAGALRAAGLGRVTVSLDSLDDEVFRVMNGRGFGTARVLDGIEAAARAGFGPIKINAVVRRGMNDGGIVALARYAREGGHVMRFIEYMDVGTLNGWKMDEVVPAAEIVSAIDAEMPLEPVGSAYRGEVAARYRYRDGGGEIGVIASVTQPFCGDCTRLRLSPEGSIYTCLFSGDGTDLRGPMRSGATDDDLAGIVTGVWRVRADRYSEIRTSETAAGAKVEMYHIGG